MSDLQLLIDRIEELAHLGECANNLELAQEGFRVIAGMCRWSGEPPVMSPEMKRFKEAIEGQDK